MKITGTLLTVVSSCVAGIAAEVGQEYGSYINPNPRPYEKCDAQDLVKLSNCCNDVLSKLDDCKADDLACECCALQSMKQECYNLCSGNPSNNFLTVLYDDCSSLNDVNACSLPFKKDDLSSPKERDLKRFKSKSKNSDLENANEGDTVTVKSRVVTNDDLSPEDSYRVNLWQDDSEDDSDGDSASDSDDKEASLKEYSLKLVSSNYSLAENLTNLSYANISCEDDQTSEASEMYAASLQAFVALAIGLLALDLI